MKHPFVAGVAVGAAPVADIRAAERTVADVRTPVAAERPASPNPVLEIENERV